MSPTSSMRFLVGRNARSAALRTTALPTPPRVDSTPAVYAGTGTLRDALALRHPFGHNSFMCLAAAFECLAHRSGARGSREDFDRWYRDRAVRGSRVLEMAVLG